MNMKHYLITGGGGLLGRRIVNLICEDNIDNVTKITVYDIRVDERTRLDLSKWCDSTGIQLSIAIGDVNDGKKLASFLIDCDVIIHTAAIIDYTGYTPHDVVWKANVEGTRTVLEVAAAKGVGSIVYTSSMNGVFPNDNVDSFFGDEDTPYSGAPILPYGKSKREAERLVVEKNGKKISGGKTMHTVALRLPWMYGENDFLIRKHIDSFKYTKTVVAFLPNKVDQCYFGNSAWAHILAARRIQTNPERVGGKFYYVTDETPNGRYDETIQAFLEHRGFTTHPRVPFLPMWLWLGLLHICAIITFLLSMVGLKFDILVTPKLHKQASVEFKLDGSKFRKEFNYRPRFPWKIAKTRVQLWVDSYMDR